jgi:signal transduction histidine kinase/MFS family permease
MNFYAIAPLINALTSLIFGLLVLIKGSKTKLRIIFTLFSFSASLWSFFYYLWQTSTNAQLALLFCQLLMFFAALIPATYFHLVMKIVDRSSKNLRFIVVTYVIFFIFGILNFLPIMITHVEELLNFPFWPIAGPLYSVFLLIWLMYVIYSNWLLIKKYKESEGIVRFQIKYILLGMILGFAGGITNYFLWYRIPIPPVGNILASAYVLSVGYAIIRYRLMDIRIVFQKIVTYIVIAGFSYGVFYFIIWLNNYFFGGIFNVGAYLLGIPLALAFSITFIPFQKLLQKITNRYLFSDVYNDQQTINNLTNKLTTIIHLDQILDLVVDTIKSTLGLERSGVLIAEKQGRVTKYKIAKVIGFDEHNGISLVQDNFLTEYLSKSKKSMVAEELDFMIEGASETTEADGYLRIKENMKKIEASLCLPLIYDNQLIGIIVLGSKVSGDAYTKEDLELLQVLANQTAIAINNARSYKQVKDFNKTLKVKVDEQTKDIQEKADHLEKLLKMRSEFLDIASHQLRTPTSVIKGTLAMMREGDMEKMSVAEKAHFVEGMFQKSVKLESIINDILVASEMDTADFDIKIEDQIELDQFLEKEVKEHQFDAEEKKIALSFEKLSTGPFKIKGNAKYLEQVVDNLLSNSLKYTPQGSIKATIKNDKDNAIIAISDTGIGVPKEDLERIFNKFIRGKNACDAYTDGSGLGLFIIKRVMDKHLGSKVWVESEEGKGSTFYLQFPLIKT